MIHNSLVQLYIATKFACLIFNSGSTNSESMVSMETKLHVLGFINCTDPPNSVFLSRGMDSSNSF